MKGITKGTRALRAASTSAAVAETALASANTAVATTGAAAAVSMRSLLLTLGPIALALAAVAAVFVFFKSAADDVDDVTDALDRQKKALDDIADVRLHSISLRLDFGDLKPEEQIDELKERFQIETAKLKREAENELTGPGGLGQRIKAATEAAQNRGQSLPELQLARFELQDLQKEKVLKLAELENNLTEKSLLLNRDIRDIKVSQREVESIAKSARR